MEENDVLVVVDFVVDWPLELNDEVLLVFDKTRFDSWLVGIPLFLFASFGDKEKTNCTTKIAVTVFRDDK